LAAIAAALAAFLSFLPPAAPKEPGPARTAADPSWLDRIEPEERACLERGVGYAPPELTADLAWFNARPLRWVDLRGKVVVVQSWSSAAASGRNWVSRAESIFAGEPDVLVIALHTPEGAEEAPAFLERRALGVPVAVDARGAFCDQIGAFRRPVNVVVDRNGVLRYAGLTAPGLKRAVALLLKEPLDPAAVPTPRPADRPAAPEFPPGDGPPGSAADFRGKKAPDLNVQQWINGPGPRATGRVTVVEFWATWCGPCRMSIPHLNDLARALGDDAVFIGLSSEDRAQYMKGLARYKIDPAGFRYHIGLDPAGKAAGALRVSGIPHTIVVGRDGTVRWQGHPAGLDEATLRRIVQADGGAAPCRHWAARKGS
jgi:thiol-disulfide isomerase/thioredoxin